jgi:two-component system sensor histidine kinase RegB
VAQELAAPAEGAAPLQGSGSQPRAQRADPNRIKLTWLIKLRWWAILGQMATVVVVLGLEIIHLNVPALGALFALETLANMGLELWIRQTAVVRERVVASVMLLDAAMLTLLLAFTGGYSNPFSILYLVNVALAAMLLRPVWAWTLLGASLALFGSLFALDGLKARGIALSDYDHMELMKLHLRGMWAAFVIAAAFIVHIVGRVTRELAARERELAAERSLSHRKDKVASLATLAAGAAHELSTPLATIAVVTRELERALDGSAPSGAQEDLALIRVQLGRCQDILHQMSAHAGEHVGEPFVPLTLSAWAEQALAGLPDRDRVKVLADGDTESHRIQGPPRALARALRSLLKNAVQASPPGSPVQLWLGADDEEVRAEVLDVGSGMPHAVLNRAGEPFFTTKGPGEGMGLGLFLARTLAEQLGGHLDLDSVPGKGTRARLRFPAAGASNDGGLT